VLVGALAGAGAVDAQLVVENRDSREAAGALAARLAAHRHDAVLLPPPLCDDSALLDALAQVGLPVGRIATSTHHAGARTVSIDDEAAAFAMTAHLIALGHRRIGFIAGDPNQTASALRRAGFERALAEAGLPLDPAWVQQGDFTYRSGLDAAEALIALAPTAIFASNDDMAAAAIAVAHRHRRDVPAELSICGFDDSAMARTIWPEITTIRQPIAEMARLAVVGLAGDARAPGADDAARHERLDFELVRRASDGPPGG
jgi:LacI family transcriptional regulator